MELIKITEDNLETEHICCAISNSNDIQVISKKNWLKQQLCEGLVFLKGNVRGKCFIEYIPAEKAWVPVEAEDYLYINCLWVAGQYKGQGYSNQLLEACLHDAKTMGKKGVVTLSSKKKMGYLADSKFLKYKGFTVVDSAEPYFELMALCFEEKGKKPCFKNSVKEGNFSDSSEGFTLYYTSQCPFTAKYVPLLQEVAKQRNARLDVIHIQTREQAQAAITPFTSFSLFYQGKWITHEILSEKKFESILSRLGY